MSSRTRTGFSRRLFSRACELLERRGLAFDYVGILPRHLAHVPVLAERLPGLRIVIDHLAKPPITAGSFEPWASQLAAAAAAPNVYAKLSGLDAGDANHWSAADLVRWADHALRCFGPERLMFGSDWPVCLLRGGYAKVWRETQKLLSGMSDDERAQVLGGAAITAYRLTSLNLGHRLTTRHPHRRLYHPDAHLRQSSATSPVSKPVPGACWRRCLRRPEQALAAQLRMDPEMPGRSIHAYPATEPRWTKSNAGNNRRTGVASSAQLPSFAASGK